jgi:acetylornithine deacetylase/succinyl-diaminopimelate desuccinylase-like protein
VVAALFLAALAARGAADELDWARLGREAAELLAGYIRIDTTNPPGNEGAAAEFLAGHFRGQEIPVQLFAPEPKRASVLARLPGSGKGRPIVLLNHLDVVAASPSDWQVPPFEGLVRDGWVHGRGALDCKGPGVIEAIAMSVLKRFGTRLARDVIFLGTADEEAGGARGAGWFVERHFDALGGPEFVLNEGGSIQQHPEGKRAYEVAVVEKTPLWLRLTARGEPGHGSTPRGTSAVMRLVRALERIRRFEPRLRVTPEVERYYRALSALYEGSMRERYADLGAALRDPDARQQFLTVPEDAALVRNTISMTVLRSGEKTNVVPATASAELDCRLLPGEDPADFRAELAAVIDDAGIEVEVLLSFPPSSSSTDTALYRAIEKVAATEGLPVVPSVVRGFTDSHYFREKGVTSYGFVPIVETEEDERMMHGRDERISLQNLSQGTRRLVEILRALDTIDSASRTEE